MVFVERNRTTFRSCFLIVIGENFHLCRHNDSRTRQPNYFILQMVEQKINSEECKLKCYVKPMKDPLGVSSSKGNQGTTRGKEKILVRPRRSVGRVLNGRSNPEVMGSIPTEVKRIFSLPRVVP